MPNIDPAQMITRQDKETAARQARFEALARLRWQYETGGLALPDGAHVATTRESQAQIASTVQALQAGLIAGPVAWKFLNGWQDLTPEAFGALAQAVSDHVTRCFAAERQVCDRMQALSGSLSDLDVGAAFMAALSE
jgi:hypothetical protein